MEEVKISKTLIRDTAHFCQRIEKVVKELHHSSREWEIKVEDINGYARVVSWINSLLPKWFQSTEKEEKLENYFYKTNIM